MGGEGGRERGGIRVNRRVDSEPEAGRDLELHERAGRGRGRRYGGRRCGGLAERARHGGLELAGGHAREGGLDLGELVPGALKRLGGEHLEEVPVPVEGGAALVAEGAIHEAGGLVVPHGALIDLGAHALIGRGGQARAELGSGLHQRGERQFAGAVGVERVHSITVNMTVITVNKFFDRRTDGGRAAPTDVRRISVGKSRLARGPPFAWAGRMLRKLGAGAVVGAWVWPWCPVGVAPAVAAGVGAAVLGAVAPTARTGAAAFFVAGLMLGGALVARVPAGPEVVGEVRVRGVVATAAEGRRADVELAALGRPGEAPLPASGRLRVIFPGRPPPAGTSVLVAGEARRIDPTHLPGRPAPLIEAARAGVRSEVLARDAARLGRPRPPPDLSAARHAALLRAFVDGDATALDADEVALLKRTGTWHVVSISGLHVGLGAAFGYGLVWLLTRPLVLVWRSDAFRWITALGGLLGAAGYADLADWGVPARRAVWMAGAALVATAGSRTLHSGKALALSALGVLFVEPGAVGSLGFQLSFSGLLGMILVGPRLARLVPPDLPGGARWVANGVVSSLGATLGTLPVVALNFQSLSWLTPVANLWAVPWLASLATPLAVLAAALTGAPQRLVLAFADAAVDVGLFGLRLVDVPPLAPAVGTVGALVLLASLGLWRREWLALGLVASGLAWPRRTPSELVVTFLAIGQGDAAIAEWPDGRVWLVDGGPPGPGLLRYLRGRGIRRLDTVFLSHLHPDHFGGLVPVVAELDVRLLVADALPAELELGRVSEWSTRHPDLVLPQTGFVAEEENDRSLVLRLRQGNRSLLLVGDAERDEEAALVRAHGAALRADVLKLGHHGSRTSSTGPLLAAVHPAAVVVSAGFDNRYRHPHGETLARVGLLLPATQVWRTDLDGSVEVRTDGRELSVRALGGPERWRGR